jgi:glycosyltransferase involved in cell wall biosynthesis
MADANGMTGPRVLHVTNAYPYPGVPEYGVFVKEQIAALQRYGVDCEVHFINARRDGKKAYLDAIADVRALARGFDVVHCHHLYSGLVAAAARVKAPLVVSFQNDWLREVELPTRAVKWAPCRSGVALADRVIFKSPIPPQFRGAKFVHLPNGVNEGQFYVTSQPQARERLGLDANATYILFVSSKDIHRPQKRYDRFTQTLDILRASDPARDYRELVMVNQERAKVIDFFNAADLHLLCSDFEGSPNSVKEALCTGLPVVATEVGNVVEMLDGVPCCEASPSFEASALAEAIARCLSAECDREAVRDAFLAKGLTAEAVTRKLAGLYQGLVEERAA